MTPSLCPKCHYRRMPTDINVHKDLCPACGISYSKWLARRQVVPPQTSIVHTPDVTLHARLRQLSAAFNYVPERIEPSAFWGRVCLLLALTLWGGYFIRGGLSWEIVGGSFMHNINLPFHEFGHVFFRPFGRFMTILGGSLFQILLPLALTLVFVVKQRDTFAASVTLWWCGQSFIDLAPYIADAKYRSLPLVGGGGEESHDWGNLLTLLNALDYTGTLAKTCFSAGALIIGVALMWGGRLLYSQRKTLLAAR